MHPKDGGWDFSELEKEIDAAVDARLVSKKQRAEPISQPSKIVSPPKSSTEVTPPLTPAIQRQVPTRVSSSKALLEKLEEVEAQLLTLEWDISAKHINDAISHLQDLRKLAHSGDELEQVIILIQKVLHQLILDENKLTPAALKFLQKSWRAIKGMTDERYASEIDKSSLVRELMAEYHNLRIEGPLVTSVGTERQPRPVLEHIVSLEQRISGKAREDTRVPMLEIDRFMNQLENLMRIVNEERKKWEQIKQEIEQIKTSIQHAVTSISVDRESQEGMKEKKDKMSTEDLLSFRTSSIDDIEKKPIIKASLFNISGIIFGIPEKQIIRIFPIKRWVADFFIEKGKVKLKNREIPLFNMVQVFKLKPSTEENPQVLLLRGKADRAAAIIIDKAITTEEIEYQPLAGRPYIIGQGISRGNRVWILDSEQLSP